MWQHHVNPPAPFNSDADPMSARYAQVSASMTRDGFYATHTTEECAREWRRRYDSLVLSGEALVSVEESRRAIIDFEPQEEPEAPRPRF